MPNRRLVLSEQARTVIVHGLAAQMKLLDKAQKTALEAKNYQAAELFSADIKFIGDGSSEGGLASYILGNSQGDLFTGTPGLREALLDELDEACSTEELQRALRMAKQGQLTLQLTPTVTEEIDAPAREEAVELENDELEPGTLGGAEMIGSDDDESDDELEARRARDEAEAIAAENVKTRRRTKAAEEPLPWESGE